MWNVCRAAALQQLKRSATASTSKSALALALNSRIAATPHLGAVHHFTNVAGVDRDFILSRSPKELRVELGNAKLVSVQQALEKELDDALAKDEVVPEDIKDIFVAAQKTKATPVMLRAFEYMQHAYPNKVDFAMLGEVFRIMMRAREGDKMFAVYEHLRSRFQSAPEMVYRFGIIGKIEQGDLDGANAIWDEMLEAGHATPNEVSSRMLQAYARAGDRERALEIFHSLDPQIGQWHESAIDRVILSLGVIQQPQLAFEFYINSSMKLNGGTLMALLSVCVSNNCHQQAADILANRKRFDLQLDARAYNRILTTLEFLGHHSEIRDVLEEMKANNTRFDTMTRSIIERNAEHLEGTSFASESDASGSNAANKKQSSYFAAPKIRELLKQNESAEAAALVDEHVKPLLESDVPAGTPFVEGALKVPAFLAKDAVSAYIKTGNHDKVARLLQTFSTVEGNYGHALAEIMTHYGAAGPDKNDDLAYAATKALLFQGRQIFRVDDALALFRKFKDVASMMTLFTQVINEFAASKQEHVTAASSTSDEASDDASAAPPRKRFSQFNIGRVINMALQTFVENRELAKALEALEYLDKHGLQPTSFNYAVVFNTMRDQNNKSNKNKNNKAKGNNKNKNKTNKAAVAVVYDADTFERVWEGMRRRNVRVTKSIVGNVCASFASGNKRQRLLLLEAYAEAKDGKDDNYVLPMNCYTTLLQLVAHEGSLAEIQSMFDDAVASLGASSAGRVPRDWVSTLVLAQIAHGDADAAHAQFLQMQEQCGAFGYDALIGVLRAAVSASDKAKTAQLIDVFETHKFRLNLQDTYDFVHMARDTNQPHLALDALQLFEAAHVSEDGELQGVNLSDMRSATKLRTMYRVTLNACEQNGQWKNALRLRERVAKILGEDAIAETPAAKARATASEHEA